MGRKRIKTLPVHTKLKALVQLTYGWKHLDGVYQIPKEKLEKHFFNYDSKSKFYKISNKTLQHHLDKKIKLYFSSNINSENDVCFCAIDSDLKIKDDGEFRGDPDHMPLWSAKLAKLVPGITNLVSAGGWGMNSPLRIVPGIEFATNTIFEKNTKCNEILKRLEKCLEEYRLRSGIDITKVEVKGSCTVVDYEKQNINLGSLIALPRTEGEADVWLSAPIFTFKTLSELCDRLVHLNASLAPVFNSAKEKHKGSGAFELVEDYGRFVTNFVIKDEVRSNDGRYVVTENDWNVFVNIILHLQKMDKRKKDEDRNMSFARIKGFWQFLTEDNIISVGYQDRKITAMRNALSKAGFVKWEDNRYEGGKACKFTISDNFLQVYGMLKEHKTDSIVTHLENGPKEVHLMPVPASLMILTMEKMLEIYDFGLKPVEECLC